MKNQITIKNRQHTQKQVWDIPRIIVAVVVVVLIVVLVMDVASVVATFVVVACFLHRLCAVFALINAYGCLTYVSWTVLQPPLI